MKKQNNKCDIPAATAGLFYERKIELSLKRIYARDLKAIQSFQISSFFFSCIVVNVMDVATRLVIAQLPIQNKDCEITAIPELLKLLDIRESTITIDAIGTQTKIMKQILEQGGHFVLTVKRNQPQSYEEIMKYFKEMSEDYKKMQDVPSF